MVGGFLTRRPARRPSPNEVERHGVGAVHAHAERRASSRNGASSSSGEAVAETGCPRPLLAPSKRLERRDEGLTAPAVSAPERSASDVATDARLGLTCEAIAERLRPLRLARPSSQPFTASMVESWMRAFARRGIVERDDEGRWRLTPRAEAEMGLALRELRHDDAQPETRRRLWRGTSGGTK